jgi:hypothetical protein
MVDKDWENFKCEDCGRDIKDANKDRDANENYKYVFLGHHINDGSKHKKVCFPCFFSKNPGYGDLYRRVVIVELDSNPPHSFIRKEDIKEYSGGNQSSQKAPEGTSKPVVNNKDSISKGEWVLIIGEVLIISLILIGLFCYLRKNKQELIEKFEDVTRIEIDDLCRAQIIFIKAGEILYQRSRQCQEMEALMQVRIVPHRQF